MNAHVVIRQIMKDRNVKYDELAESLGFKTQSLKDKIGRGKYKLIDFLKLMDALECDVQIVTRKNGENHKVYDLFYYSMNERFKRLY